jgi:hypothetical protein
VACVACVACVRACVHASAPGARRRRTVPQTSAPWQLCCFVPCARQHGFAVTPNSGAFFEEKNTPGGDAAPPAPGARRPHPSTPTPTPTPMGGAAGAWDRSRGGRALHVPVRQLAIGRA